MNIYQIIFNLLSAQFPILADGQGGFHIYPNTVPDDVVFTKAIIYTAGIGGAVRLNAETQIIQFTTVAKTYEDAYDLCKDIQVFFQNKRGTTPNEPMYTQSESVIRSQGLDREVGYWTCSVDVLFKTNILL